MILKFNNLRITYIGEPVSGFSKSGIPYCLQNLIVCNEEGINFCFSLWNEFANLALSINDIVSIIFIIKCDRFKKKWYTELIVKDIIPIKTKNNILHEQ